MMKDTHPPLQNKGEIAEKANYEWEMSKIANVAERLMYQELVGD